jgi:hypothetical protein
MIDPLRLLGMRERLTRSLQHLRSWLASSDDPLGSPPEDPYAHVRVPRRRSPGGRSSAVAVAEPEPSINVRAQGEPMASSRRSTP